MATDLSVEHTANAGLFIRIDGVKFLIDTLFQEDNDFSTLSDMVKDDMFSKAGRYADVDCVLFTHGHYDHYDYQMTRKYLNMFPESKIAAPESVFAVGGWTVIDFRKGNIISFSDNKDGCFKIGEIEVYYYRTSHLDYDFSHFGFHYSFVIKKDNISLFISGDAKFDERMSAILDGEKKLTAAFFNPAALYSRNGREILAGIDSEKNYIYHLPQAGSDRLNYRKYAVKFYEKYKNRIKKCSLLLGEQEEVEI